jgi:hypothetical protein
MTTLGILICGIEYLHHRDHGHFVSYGLQEDALNRDADIGIPAAPFVIQDQVIRGNGSFRVRH